MKRESNPVKPLQRALLLKEGTVDGMKVPLGVRNPNRSASVGKPGDARYSVYGIRLRPRT
jgi:hypothetical protein